MNKINNDLRTDEFNKTIINFINYKKSSVTSIGIRSKEIKSFSVCERKNHDFNDSTDGV